MKVKLIRPRATARGAQDIGDEIDVSREEADRLISAGHAIPVRRERQENTSRKSRTEKAVQ